MTSSKLLTCTLALAACTPEQTSKEEAFLPGVICPHEVGAEVSASAPMFSTTAETLLEQAAHTATGPGKTDLVLPGIEDDFTVTHSFSFVSANEAEFDSDRNGCPEGSGFVIEAEQTTVFSFGNQVVEGTSVVQFFIGEDAPSIMLGQLVEQRPLDGITQELVDAVADAHGAPQCGPDVFRLGAYPNSDAWVRHRDEGYISASRSTCEEATGIIWSGTVASLNRGTLTESTTTSSKGTP